MNSVRTIVEYQDKKYTGEATELLDGELTMLESALEDVAKGKVTFLSIKTENGIVFFSKEILAQSVITLSIEKKA